MSLLVVTGTGTEVGKTVVSAAVCAAALHPGSPVPTPRVAYLKTAQTGVAAARPVTGERPDDADIDTVRRLVPGVVVAEGPRYPDPLSPAAAARVAGLPPVDLSAVSALARDLAARHDLVVLEGAGGLLVPYDDRGGTLADLARDLDAPVLVVTAAGLGTLNVTALTLEALAARSLTCAGVVIGSWPKRPGLAERCNLADLAGGSLAGVVPEGAGTLEPQTFRRLAADVLGSWLQTWWS